MNITQLEHEFRASEELQLKLVRDTGMYTVALFAVFDGKANPLQLAGTGSLVEVAGSHYILTAAHVWHKILKYTTRVGITLAENMLMNEFSIEPRTITPVGPPKPEAWGEWGPDIVFLRVPREYIGTIKAYRVFYVFTAEENVPSDRVIQTQLLFGTPKELGKFSPTQAPTRAQLSVTGFYGDAITTAYTQGDFDYIDFPMGVTDLAAQGGPTDFGGVSGGGLWNVQIFESPSTGLVDSVATLQGVAFWSSIANGEAIIRCHGPATIRKALPV